MTSSNQIPEHILRGLRVTLDRHGYGFQYRVLKRIEELFMKGSAWIFYAAEFPVEVRGCSTRIDFVLCHKDENLYLVAECKRANPALSDWCFVKIPYVRRGAGSEAQDVIVERISATNQLTIVSGSDNLGYSGPVYHLALEVKSDAKGDLAGQGRGVIEEAASQVLRGANGLVEFLQANWVLHQKNKPQARIVPVIFTTATLWTTNVDLETVDLTTGKLDPSRISGVKAPWVWYRCHMSPGLKHTVQPDKCPDSLAEALDQLYARTIAVVSAEGIDQFLRGDWW
jgi:hypothetical protein